MTERLMTSEEVADRLQVALRTVREWVRTGRLQSYRAGNLYRISEDQLQAFLQPSKGE